MPGFFSGLAAPQILFVAGFAVDAKARPYVVMDRPSDAATRGERGFVGRVAEGDLSLAVAEIGPAQGANIAVSHGELEHKGGGDPFACVGAVFEGVVPSLDFCENGIVGADVSRRQAVVGGELDGRDLPLEVGVVGEGPAGEHAFERGHVAPDRDGLESLAAGEIEHSGEAFAGERRVGFVEGDLGHLAEAFDVHEGVADGFRARSAHSQAFDGGDFGVFFENHLDCGHDFGHK